jgi:hypothetical protein
VDQATHELVFDADAAEKAHRFACESKIAQE